MLNTSYLIGKVEPEVIDTLETMTSYLQQIPNIHQGGCAISALLMQEHLLNKHAIHADIIYTYECSKYSNSYLTNVKGLNSNNYKESATCEHAILDLCGYRFDAKRDYNFNYMLDEADVCELIMPTEFVLHSVNHALWSNIFDRRYIPQLLEYFDSKLPIQIKITIQTNN